MREELTERGFLHTVRLKKLKKPKADNDGEWGEIEYDCKTGQFRIIKQAELDLTKSQPLAKQAIQRIRHWIQREVFPKKGQVWFPL